MSKYWSGKILSNYWQCLPSRLIDCHSKWNYYRELSSLELDWKSFIVWNEIHSWNQNHFTNLVPCRVKHLITWFPILLTCIHVPLHKPFDWSMFLNNMTGTLSFRINLCGGNSELGLEVSQASSWANSSSVR